MKKGCLTVIILMALLVLFVRYASFERFTPTFLAGRDTVAYWNQGEFELMRGSGYYVLFHFSPDGEGQTTLNTPGNSVCAYRETGRMLYVLLEEGYLVIDLESSAVQAFASLDEMGEAQRKAFAAGGFRVLKE